MSSIEITCEDCGKIFYFTDKDQAYYKEKDYSQPKRCFDCRQKRKADWEAKQKDYKNKQQ